MENFSHLARFILPGEKRWPEQDSHGNAGWFKFRRRPPHMLEEYHVKSWRNTELDNRWSAGLWINGYMFEISTVKGAEHWDSGAHTKDMSEDGVAEFWQSDDYEAVPGYGSKLLCRRVQMKTPEGWLILEVDAKTSEHIIYLSEKRI